MSHTGVVLTGGGARAAYQVGVLRAMTWRAGAMASGRVRKRS
jgi:predicted acylesterase/phospholipase RssA